MRRFVRSPVTALLAAIPAFAEPVVAQQAVLSGRVVEQTQLVPVAWATVRLAGADFSTDADGRFRFTGVAPGRLTLFVDAYGYAPFSTELTVRGDTTVQVVLEPVPIALDSLRS